MKLLRYGQVGQEKPGVLDGAGVIRDLSGHIADITPQTVTPEGLARLAAIDIDSLPKIEGDVRYGVPVGGVRKFIAIGLNFADHAREAGLEPPKEPIFFTKAISCLVGANDDVILPEGSQKLDWEVELGVVISKTARYVKREDAMSHVAGFVLVNDVSERAFQKELGSQWDKGKGCDTFGPVGPWLVTPDEVGDHNQLGMWLKVNGATMQNGNSSTMIFQVDELVAYLSRFVTLWPGDIVTTGTPPGVGEGQKPNSVYLKPGDVMELGIDKLGVQRQTVVPFRI